MKPTLNGKLGGLKLKAVNFGIGSRLRYDRAMEEALLNFPAQLAWAPTLENRVALRSAAKFIIGGMGGSHLAAGLLKIREPKLDLLIHRDYDLPSLPDYFLNEGLLIASSYSGNTEETISFFEAARARGLNLAVIASGGRLLDLAREHSVPYVALPTDGIQPRVAIGYALKALLALMGREDLTSEVTTLASSLKPAERKGEGAALAGRLAGRAPLLYAGTRHWPLAYAWKITFNETAKQLAFANVLPEANHNELEGFDGPEAERAALAERYAPIFLTDPTGDPRLARRFEVLEQLLTERGLTAEIVPLAGGTIWEKIFNSWLLANWTALALAQARDLDPAAVPLIEELKKRLS